MKNDQPLTLEEVIDEVHRLETSNADLNESIDEWEVLANKLAASNTALRDAAKHALKVLAPHTDPAFPPLGESMLVSQLREAIDGSEVVFTDET